jgi:hypothetical protein
LSYYYQWTLELPAVCLHWQMSQGTGTECLIDLSRTPEKCSESIHNRVATNGFFRQSNALASEEKCTTQNLFVAQWLLLQFISISFNCVGLCETLFDNSKIVAYEFVCLIVIIHESDLYLGILSIFCSSLSQINFRQISLRFSLVKKLIFPRHNNSTDSLAL